MIYVILIYNSHSLTYYKFDNITLNLCYKNRGAQNNYYVLPAEMFTNAQDTFRYNLRTIWRHQSVIL